MENKTELSSFIYQHLP